MASDPAARKQDPPASGWIREWFLRAVLILVDSMPVLVKFLGGVTEYDRAVDVCVGRDRAVHRARVSHDQNSKVEELRRKAEVADAEADMQVRRRLNALQSEEQQHIDEEQALPANGRDLGEREVQQWMTTWWCGPSLLLRRRRS